MRTKKWKKASIIISLLALAAIALSGCSGGSDGAAGAAGTTGPTGPTGPSGPSGATLTSLSSLTADQLASLTLTGEVTSVTIASPPVVNFTVKDGAGKGVAGLDAASTTTPANLANLRFTIAKLVPGENGSPDKWVSYMVTDTSRPTTERVAANLVSHGDGTYTYTFSKDLAAVTGVTYDATAKHRLGIRISSSPIINPAAIFYDWIPATGATVAAADQRNITSKDACNSCHGAMNNTAHGTNYVDTKMCVLCHTDQQRLGQTNVTSTAGAFTGEQTIADGEVLADFPVMIHKIHGGSILTKTGYDFAGILFNDMVYPQEVINCRKCHNSDVGSGTGAQGGNWKTRPSRLACGACHDNVNFATGANHGLGGIRTDDSMCVLCHDAVNIETNHISVNATTNNPSVPTGAADFTYEISSVTGGTGADLNKPIVTFRILKDGTPVVFNTYTGATDAAAWTFAQRGLLTNFAGSPSFLVAYADGQDAIASADMVDFNNLGRWAAQPASVSIAELAIGSAGTLALAGASAPAGSYVATLNQQVSRNWSTGAITGVYGPGTTPLIDAKFPATAKMRTVALQGYFTQTNLTDSPYTAAVLNTSNASGGLARHAIMVTKSVTGESRRQVVDSAKCAACHEYFEGHGGNRNYNMDGCTLCHNPNLSSSGRMVTLTVPEATQNLKDMIHGIHGAEKRGADYPYKHSRAKAGSQTTYDWSEVGYPGSLKNCLTCHLAGTYGSVPSKALATTNVTTSNAAATYNAATSVVTDALATVTTFSGTTSTTAVPSGGKYINVKGTVNLARDSVANTTDLVISPFAAACVACHASEAARAHMGGNGGWINAERTTVTSGGTVTADSGEQCVVCHGTGKDAGVDVKHR